MQVDGGQQQQQRRAGEALRNQIYSFYIFRQLLQIFIISKNFEKFR